MPIEFYCDKCGWFTREEMTNPSTFSLGAFKLETTCSHCRARLAALDKHARKPYFKRLRDALFGDATVFDHVSMHRRWTDRDDLKSSAVFDDCQVGVDDYGRPSIRMVYDSCGYDSLLTVDRLLWLFGALRTSILILKWQDCTIGITVHYSGDDAPYYNYSFNGQSLMRHELQHKLDSIWTNHKFLGVMPDSNVDDLLTSSTPIRVAHYNICTEARDNNFTLPPACKEKAEQQQAKVEELIKEVSGSENKIVINVDLDRFKGNAEALAKTMQQISDQYCNVDAFRKARTFTGLTPTQYQFAELPLQDVDGRIIGTVKLDPSSAEKITGSATEWSVGYIVKPVPESDPADGPVRPEKDCSKAALMAKFERWVMAKQHPVYGFLDGHWLKRGDVIDCYANEYVEGLWVAYQEFANMAVTIPAQQDFSNWRAYSEWRTEELERYDNLGVEVNTRLPAQRKPADEC